MNLFRIAAVALAGWAAFAQGSVFGAAARQPGELSHRSSMAVGVDDAGSEKPVWLDAAAQQAFDEIGFDYLSHHIWGTPPPADLEPIKSWSALHHKDFLINLDNAGRTPGDPAIYDRPGSFFQPSPGYLTAGLASPHFLGITYDEIEHWMNDGGWKTIIDNLYAPVFYDAAGVSLDQAYVGNLHNVSKMMKLSYPGLAQNAKQGRVGPVINGEYVFPVLQHLLGRAGFVPTPKYLMACNSTVDAAVGMGAAKQYGLRYWALIDLWGRDSYPGHPPDELDDALVYTYWTGAERTTVENFNYKDSLYHQAGSGIELSGLGRSVRRFRLCYLRGHPRPFSIKDFRPEIIIVKFEDGDWGQKPTGNWISGRLYDAPNLLPDEQTRYWIKIWQVLSHNTMPPQALSYHSHQVTQPYQLMFPVNNAAVYDHLASDPALYSGVKLVILTGKIISQQCLNTLKKLVRKQGITVVTLPNLAGFLKSDPNRPYTETRAGKGCWIATTDLTRPAVVKRLERFLGPPDTLRYRFANWDVRFTNLGPGLRPKLTVSRAETQRR